MRYVRKGPGLQGHHRRTAADIVDRYPAGEELELPGRRGALDVDRQLSPVVLMCLLSLLLKDEALCLEELAARLELEFEEEISFSSVWRSIRELDWSHKQVSSQAATSRLICQQLDLCFVWHMQLVGSAVSLKEKDLLL